MTHIKKLSEVVTKKKDEIANEEEKREKGAKLEEEEKTAQRSNPGPRRTASAREKAIRTRDNRKETNDGEDSENCSSKTAQTENYTIQIYGMRLGEI